MPISELEPAGRKEEAADEADDDARQRDHVRENLVLQVGDEEHDQRARKDHAHETEQREPVGQIRDHEHERGDDLDRGIHPRHRLLARAAPAAERDPAEDGKIVEPGQHAAARRAARPRMHHRLAERQPIGADVQEAADAEPEQRDGQQLEPGRASPRARLRSGKSVESRATSTDPETGSSAYMDPVGSTRDIAAAVLARRHLVPGRRETGRACRRTCARAARASRCAPRRRAA